MLTKIKVLDKHINKGFSDVSYCPVALAIKDIIKPNIDVSVMWENIYIENVDRIRTTTRMKRFIRKFDNGGDIAPTNFLIDLPKKLLK